MKNRKGTKRALLMSVLSLLLCFSMLVGTTFAWFTDSVTSANNIIKSGDLEVGMYWADGTKAVPALDTADNAGWTNAEGGAMFTEDQLWEPGYVDVKHIMIKNEGALALKYALSIVANGEVSILSDVIDVYFIDPAVKVEGRSALTDENKLGTLTEVLEGLKTGTFGTGTLLAGKAVAVTLALKMQETAGNDYEDKSIGTDFSIKLLATQMAYEGDSFDDQYDAGADFIPAWDGSVVESLTPDENGVYHITNAAELAYVNTLVSEKAAEGRGLKIVLDADINLGNVDWTPIGSEQKSFYGTFNGQGYTVYNVNVTKSGNAGEPGDSGFFGVIKDGATKVENLNLVNVSVSVENGERLGALVGKSFFADITNCSVTNATVSGHSKVAAIVGDCYGADVTNCTVTGANLYATAKAAATVVGRANASEGGTVTLVNNTATDCTVIAPTQIDYILGVSTYSDAIDLSTNTYENVNLVVGSATVVATANDLLALGGKSLEGVVVLTNDIDLDGAAVPTIGAAYGKELVVLGNGHTISNGTTAHTTHNGMKHHGLFYAYTNSTLTISNLIVDNVDIDATKDTERNYGAGILVAFADGGSNVTLNNVDVKNCDILNNIPDLGDEAGIYVGYQTGTLTMIDCDSTGCTVVGETTEKTGAFIGMVNGTATLTNCTTDLTIGTCNRVSGTLTEN